MAGTLIRESRGGCDRPLLCLRSPIEQIYGFINLHPIKVIPSKESQTLFQRRGVGSTVAERSGPSDAGRRQAGHMTRDSGLTVVRVDQLLIYFTLRYRRIREKKIQDIVTSSRASGMLPQARSWSAHVPNEKAFCLLKYSDLSSVGL